MGKSSSGVPLARSLARASPTPHCATALLSMGLLGLRAFSTLRAALPFIKKHPLVSPKPKKILFSRHEILRRI